MRDNIESIYVIYIPPHATKSTLYSPSYSISSSSKPTVGKELAKSLTSFLSWTSSGSTLGPTAHISLNPLIFFPCSVPFSLTAIFTARSKYSATRAKSSSPKPLDVNAGVPILIPPGFNADVSPGTVFLLDAMHASSSMRSTLAPSIALELLTFTSTRWLSVPPDTTSYPILCSSSDSLAQFFRTCFWYWTNSGVFACFSATDRAPIVWLCGPPCRPGNTAKLIFSSMSYMIGSPFFVTPLCPLR
mmetsp:Transcript_6521/g.14763  ORF Transcript_6521/g.14763 Transcript_6521/m.14763 type:complete len:245 (+) Transcript_6521:14-748(+)